MKAPITNSDLHRALRAAGLEASAGAEGVVGDRWRFAKLLVGGGFSLNQAVVQVGRKYPHVAPVLQAPDPEATPRMTREAKVAQAPKARKNARLNAQAKAVKNGEVQRDAQGRILPRSTDPWWFDHVAHVGDPRTEALRELSALNA